MGEVEKLNCGAKLDEYPDQQQQYEARQHGIGRFAFVTLNTSFHDSTK
jgi:hypothetical protein